MFALYSVYLKPVEEVDRHLEAHRAFLKTLYEKGITICSGPQIPRTGGFILMNASSIEFEVKSFAKGFEELIR